MSQRVRSKRTNLKPILWDPPQLPTVRKLYRVRVVETIARTMVVDAEDARQALRRVERDVPCAKVIGCESRSVDRKAFVVVDS